MIATAFKIHSEKSTYEWDDLKLCGELFIDIDGYSFPCKGWNDIISSVLDMWLFDINSLIKNDLCGEESFYFMDGPFHFIVNGKGFNSNIEIWLFKYDRLINKIPYMIAFADFISVLINFIDQITMNEQLSEVDEIKRLKKRCIRFKRLMRLKRI